MLNSVFYLNLVPCKCPQTGQVELEMTNKLTLLKSSEYECEWTLVRRSGYR